MKVDTIRRQRYAEQPFPGFTFIGVDISGGEDMTSLVEVSDSRGFKVLCARTFDAAREGLVEMLTQQRAA